MRRYVRAPPLAGASYFFTLPLAERHGNDRLVRHVDDLRQAFAAVRVRHPFDIEAIVVLPDHLHAIWRMPAEDGDYAKRWRLIKGAFSRAVPAGERVSASRQRRAERGIWQRRYWEHQIRDEEDLARHVDYIHFNPVKHGLVARARDWPHSSFHRFVAAGLLHPDWGIGATAPDGAFGE